MQWIIVKWNSDYSNNNDIKCKYVDTFYSSHAAQTQESSVTSKIASEYDHEIPQSQTADKLTLNIHT